MVLIRIASLIVYHPSEVSMFFHKQNCNIITISGHLLSENALSREDYTLLSKANWDVEEPRVSKAGSTCC